MRRKFAGLIAGAIMAIGAGGVTHAADADQTALAEGVNGLGVELFAKVAPANGSSVFFSPFSVEMALLMAKEGARGQTAAEMTKVLGVEGDGSQIAALLKQLNGDSQNDAARGFSLTVANALWVEKTFAILPSFTADLQKTFGTGAAFPEDFIADPEAARKQINTWVSDKTQQKIQDLLPQGSVGPETRLVLTNAIYFKASWQKPFSKEATEDQPFFAAGGKQVTLPLMHADHLFAPYAADDQVQVLSLPYRMEPPAGAPTGGPMPRLSMLIILPLKKEGLPAVEKSLTPEKLAAWDASAKGRMVNIFLPRFKTTSALTLNDALKAMGMQQAFGANADFSGIAKADRPDQRLRITGVVHKAFVSVDEEGTEAAAATGVMVGAMAMPTGEPAEFRADHPFLYLIRDETSGVVLFLGRMGGD